MTKKQDALDYHSRGRPGKIAVVPTKPLTNQRDLSLAYSPGVAEPCLEIKRDADLAYSYTAKGNLVAVVTNGTAVLGLGNIGALAGKPVMEGKGNLFKQFADIDVFDIEVGSENPDIETARAAMNAVFLAPGESMQKVVPDFWRGYFDQEDSPRKIGYSGVVYSIKRGEVSAPHQTDSPEPSYSEDARVAKYQGTMILSVVVDPAGRAADVEIVTPLGLGLDEKAVEAVRSWSFEPAMKDGQPVAVKVMIEVDFHLY